jgi:predicted MFS family arabinose efflux permease
MTWLIATYNWQAPFAVLSILTGISFIVAFFVLEPDKPESINRVSFMRAVGLSLDSKMAIAGLVLGFGIGAANQLISVMFGAWIEASFGIQLGALAAAAAVIGVSELLGEGIVTGFSDRFGKRRMVLLGIVATIIAALILPFSSFNLNAALVGLFFYYLVFETTVVAAIPLATEMSPNARAMYLTVYVAVVTFGRALFTPLAPYFFQYGFLVNCVVAAILNLIALFAVWKFIRIK